MSILHVTGIPNSKVSDKKREEEWEAQDDVRAIIRAGMVNKDSKRKKRAIAMSKRMKKEGISMMKREEKEHKEEIKGLEQLAGRKAGKL